MNGMPGSRYLSEVKLEHERVYVGGMWHSDTDYLDRPPMVALRGNPPDG